MFKTKITLYKEEKIMKTTTVSNAIASLNLETIKNKLMDAESGEGWSRAKADAMEIEYRRFLHLMHAFPDEAASPTKAVDTFWHYHILDTQKYAADCDAVFGCFMHHNPNAGEDGAAGVARTGVRMQQLYETTFGEAYLRADVYGDGARLDVAGAGTSICAAICARGKAPASAQADDCAAMCMRFKVPAAAAAYA
jgi:hypothetical protein